MQCTECSKVGMFVNQNGRCQEKIKQCKGEDESAYKVDKNGHFACKTCVKDHFWVESSEKSPGECVHCSEFIPGCSFCSFSGSCLDCEGFNTPNPSKTECVRKIEGCSKDPAFYVALENGEWMCPECGVGYSQTKEGGCMKIPIDHCETVSFDDEGEVTGCLKCKFSYMFNRFGDCQQVTRSNLGDVCSNLIEHCSSCMFMSMNDIICTACDKNISL